MAEEDFVVVAMEEDEAEVDSMDNKGSPLSKETRTTFNAIIARNMGM